MQLFPLEVFPTGTFSSETFSSELYSEDLYPAETHEQANVYNATRPIHPRCTYKEDFKRILLPAVYTAVFLVGLPLNAVVILRISRTRTNLSRSNIYMLNLATADFLYVLSLPLLIYNYASHDYWPFGELACKLVRFQFYRYSKSTAHCFEKKQY